MRALRWLSDKLNKITEVIITLLLVWLTIVLVIQVSSRYVFNSGMPWTEEMARYTMIWVIFLGAAVVTRVKEHISVPIMETLFPSLKKYLHLIQNILFLIFVVLVLSYSWSTLEILRFQTSANMGLSMALVYSVIPISFVLILIHLITNMIAGENDSKER